MTARTTVKYIDLSNTLNKTALVSSSTLYGCENNNPHISKSISLRGLVGLEVKDILRCDGGFYLSKAGAEGSNKSLFIGNWDMKNKAPLQHCYSFHRPS